MAPIEDLQARDLAWISDFVMQQMVIMLRPMMDHLQQTDVTVDYTQRAVQRLSMDVSELRGDLERTNKYLAILRQGLGAQNESKCSMQRGIESATRTVKRLDDQIDGVLGVIRGMEESIGQLCGDMRGVGSKHEELAKQVTESTSTLEDLQAKFERVSSETRSVKDDMLNNEARLEVWQRELRELRRTQLGIVPKLDEKGGGRPPPSSQSCRSAAEPWPPKKSFAPTSADTGGGGHAGGCTVNDVVVTASGGGPPSKRVSRVGSGSGHRSVLQQDLEGLTQPRSSSRANVYDNVYSAMTVSAGPDVQVDDNIYAPGLSSSFPNVSAGEEACPSARLPLLAKQPGVSRPPDAAYVAGPRLRFSETMAKPSSRGTPQ
mmetsp:Transcript_8395/g.14418  ORF Transcript_8395/g.14418 Transcript_8395/m.14418 type:complete len:375 (+) Transcript_8395:139-1263(+)